MNLHLPLRDQSKRASFIEAVTNTLIGYVIAYAATYAIVWAYDMQMSHANVSQMVNWMTLLSVLRGYVLRRLWNAEWWKRWSWRKPFSLQPHPVVGTLRHIPIPPDALLGLRPLTIEEQREVLWRLRTQHAENHSA